VAGPQFYGGPDLQRAGFWRARGAIGEYSHRLRLGEYVRVNYREGGLYVIYSPEDAQRPRAVYHIQPNFEVIN
jgi:hypothetical protein